MSLRHDGIQNGIQVETCEGNDYECNQTQILLDLLLLRTSPSHTSRLLLHVLRVFLSRVDRIKSVYAPSELLTDIQLFAQD